MESQSAGPFGSWLADLHAALRSDGGSDVPCGHCVGCCSSAQFIHIGPDERDALAHIPAELVFLAPRMPGASPGHVLMGYDEHGRRPRTATPRDLTFLRGLPAENAGTEV